jgi:ribose 5-phosphate isomerase A
MDAPVQRPDQRLSDRDAHKRAAAEAAVALVESGMVVGLGTGSTAAFAITALSRRVREEGLDIVGIPTSEASAAQARQQGIRLTDFSRHRRLDLTIDGADEVARGSLHLIKGGGGALLREKIVASASDRLVIVADAAKLVDQLGATMWLPVEVVAFGWQATADHLAAAGGAPVLRLDPAGQPFRTDSGNLILDCGFGLIADPAALERTLSQVVGVVETGLFIGMADQVLIAGADGVHRLTKGSPSP